MSIYMVQHAFSRPDWEDEWNAWYAGNLKVLMAVPGFLTGQRFKALNGIPPRYMAVYTVESPAVFESERYKQAGGGGVNSQRFRPAYKVWIRNLFEGVETAPEVRDDECLVCVDSPARNLEVPGVRLTWLESTGFHRSTPYRGIGIADGKREQTLQSVEGVTLYRPITARLGPLA